MHDSSSTTVVLGLPSLFENTGQEERDPIQSADGPYSHTDHVLDPKAVGFMHTAFYRITACLASFLIHSYGVALLFRFLDCSIALGLAAASLGTGKRTAGTA